MESTDATAEHKESTWTSVTPLSKYLAMLIFIVTPFLGGWIGYTYSPPLILEVEKNVLPHTEEDIPITPPISHAIVSIKEDEQGSFMCTHTHLNSITEMEYSDWATFNDDEFNIRFSYPPDQAPNYINRYPGEDGYLQVGYNPLLEPEYSQGGKPGAFPLNLTWDVSVQKKDNVVVDNNYCAQDYEWCLLERLDDRRELETYVSSYKESGMGAAEVRAYNFSLPDDSSITVQPNAATGFEGNPCDFIAQTFNIDKIAHSIKNK
jgi:hypothetical protein